jgi:hypothetical protein
MHRFAWNLHYALPASLAGNGMYRFTNGDGLWALPGQYTVKLTVGGQTYSQPLQIKADPRVQISPAALQQQFDLGRRIENQRMDIAKIATQAAGLRSRLTAVRGKASGSVAKSIDTLVKQIDAVAGVKPEDNPANSIGTPATDFASLLFLQGAYANLAASVESADAAPSSGKMQTLAKYQQILDAALAKWESVKTTGLPQLNAKLKAAGLEPVELPD